MMRLRNREIGIGNGESVILLGLFFYSVKQKRPVHCNGNSGFQIPDSGVSLTHHVCGNGLYYNVTAGHVRFFSRAV